MNRPLTITSIRDTSQEEQTNERLDAAIRHLRQGSEPENDDGDARPVEASAEKPAKAVHPATELALSLHTHTSRLTARIKNLSAELKALDERIRDREAAFEEAKRQLEAEYAEDRADYFLQRDKIALDLAQNRETAECTNRYIVALQDVSRRVPPPPEPVTDRKVTKPRRRAPKKAPAK